jgi:hypothetical protein
VKPELPTPKTGKEKLAHTRAVLAEFLAEIRKPEEGRDSDEEPIFGALMQLSGAVEEIGRRMPPGIGPKRPPRRKKGDRGV